GRAVAGNHPLAVGHRRGGAIWIRTVSRFLVLIERFLRPKELAVSAGEAHHGPPRAALGRLSDEHAVVPDDGRRVASVRQRRLPANVLGGGPLYRNVFFWADPVAGWATPSRPRTREHRARENQDGACRCQPADHSRHFLSSDS